MAKNCPYCKGHQYRQLKTPTYEGAGTCPECGGTGKLDPIDLRRQLAQRDKQLAKLPAAVAERLFVNGAGEKADRLCLFDSVVSRNLGGWCKAAVEDRVRQIIEATKETS